MKKSTERKMCLAVGVMVGVQVVGVMIILISNAVHKHRYHRDLLATKALELRFAGPDNMELQDPHAYTRKEGLIVSGCLNSIPSGAELAATEVDVRLLSAKGAVLHETSIRDLSQCKRGGAHFSTEIPQMPSDGSVLSIIAFASQTEASGREPTSPDPGG